MTANDLENCPAKTSWMTARRRPW